MVDVAPVRAIHGGDRRGDHAPRPGDMGPDRARRRGPVRDGCGHGRTARRGNPRGGARAEDGTARGGGRRGDGAARAPRATGPRRQRPRRCRRGRRPASRALERADQGLSIQPVPDHRAHHARLGAPRADLRAARARGGSRPRERDPAFQPAPRPSPPPAGVVSELAVPTRPVHRTRIQPDRRVPGLPAHRYATSLRQLRGLGRHGRSSAPLRRHPRADLPVVGHPPAAAAGHGRGADHGCPATTGSDRVPVRARTGDRSARARGGVCVAGARRGCRGAGREPIPGHA